MNQDATAIPIIDFKARADELLPEGASYDNCLNCGLCSSGCPASGMEGMDPRRFIRMAMLGMNEELSATSWIWTCTQCKRCTVECPFGAINEDEQRYPMFNEARCRRCGTCMGACPVRVISFENYSVDTVGQQIKNVEIPEEWDEKPRILVLACENDAYPALDQAAMNGVEINPWARVIPVRCLGSISLSWITDSLNNGYDGIVLMGCQKGDDYQCHFIRGSELMGTRGGNIQEKLTALALEEERVRVEQIEISEFEKLNTIVNEFAEEIEEIGMNPFKGF